MNKRENRPVELPILEALERHSQDERVSLHVPGHKSGFGLPTAFHTWAGDVARLDQTEVAGLDDLYQPIGPIAHAQGLAARAYGSDGTSFLVGGSTAGNLAAVLAAIGRRERVIVARNSHQSIWHALELAGARAAVMTPPLLSTGIGGAVWGPITPALLREAIAKWPDAKAVIVTSPTYTGVVSSLRELTLLAHSAGMMMIVDEAHGAHLPFHPALPESAVSAGADLVVQSLHKMTGAMTQTGLLHYSGPRVDTARLQRALRMVQTSSPSYVLLASIDTVRAELAHTGEERLGEAMERLATAADNLRREHPGLLWEATEGVPVDPFKWLLYAPALGCSGIELADQLRIRHGIFTEWADEVHVLCAWSYANSAQDVAAVVSALRDVGDHLQCKGQGDAHALSLDAASWGAHAIADLVELPLRTKLHEAPSVTVSLREAVGRRVVDAVTVYPPGVPLLLPGERMTQPLCDCIEAALQAQIRVDGLTGDGLHIDCVG
ncbi:MAG: aminotransferase class I/II-fold pyridoxal phosphate-dependent enzyme [Firmicutes bacterium]|nr:aminotransferase class I/II-fold pyridoxal phosphate-dependent enzyme [Bacillota bacterium]